MTTKPLVIFDFDGTLADSISIGIEVANNFSSLFGYAKIESIDQVRETSAVKFIFSQLPLYQLPLWAFLMKRAIRKRQDEINLYDGIKELLLELKKNYRLGIIGGGRPSYHKAILERFDVDIFDFRIGNVGVKKHKKIQKIIRNGENPANITYVGDDTADILSARIASVRSIGVTWGGTSKSTLLAAKPDYLAESVADLQRFLL
jgi:phosphoglycolate phosphatase